jgi:signal transduction histidine kinase
MQLNIFRMVQEQVNNILKHSGATRAVIKLLKLNNEIILSIADNGKGCDIKGKKNGVGIRNILSRVELFKGTLRIESKPGEGYQLYVTLPV